MRWLHMGIPYETLKCQFCSNVFASCGIKNHELSCVLNPKNIKQCKCCQANISGYRKVFCNHVCAARYNNSNKEHGCRRSKLEKWMEEKLKVLYPTLEIFFNKKFAIGSELDIYIPSLNLAFELNGVYHYKPIRGQKLLNKVAHNDAEKVKICKERNIQLFSIDTSGQSFFSESTSDRFLNTIISIIDKIDQS